MPVKGTTINCGAGVMASLHFPHNGRLHAGPQNQVGSISSGFVSDLAHLDERPRSRCRQKPIGKSFRVRASANNDEAARQNRDTDASAPAARQTYIPTWF